MPGHLRDFYRPELKPGQSAREQLEKLGIRPKDIDLVLLTHLDIDHTAALADFKDAKRIVCSEIEYFYSCRNVYKRRQVWDCWMPYIKPEDRLYYRASVLGPAGRGFDIFGDDSVICIYCPGHTDGSFATIISRSPSNRFIVHGDGKSGGPFAVITGDVAFSQRNIDTLTVPGYGFDREQQKRSLEFLKKIQKDPMHTATFFSHAEAERSKISF